MQPRLLRTELLLGEKAISALQNSHVLIVGLGGVGGYALEALARTGVGKFTLIDSDKFDETNLNRQLLCTSNSIGQYKTLIAKERITCIDKNIYVQTHELFLDKSNIDDILSTGFDLVVDAIDSVESKAYLLTKCIEKSIPVVSSMGAGFRKDPTQVKIADISNTYGDPLAKKIRRALSENGIHSGIQCVFSSEKPADHGSNTIASIASVTGAMGLTLGQLAINTLISQ